MLVVSRGILTSIGTSMSMMVSCGRAGLGSGCSIALYAGGGSLGKGLIGASCGLSTIIVTVGWGISSVRRSLIRSLEGLGVKRLSEIGGRSSLMY